MLDEAHVYKGVFGANVANIIRRVLIRSRREGNPHFPQIIISSATVRHPDRLAYQLTGLKNFTVIDRSGAPRPRRHFLVTRSDIHDLNTICYELLTGVTTRDLSTGEERPVSVIVFLRSIKDVKNETQKLQDALIRSGYSKLAHQAEAFYGEKSDKQDILSHLQSGKIRCVFSTTALMAGIDIGSLDIAIVKDYPGMVMDARQMFGRAGRASEGAAIFIANLLNPFDQFYFEKPSKLFFGPTEDVVANPENPILLAQHLLCAAQAVPGKYKNLEGPLPGKYTALFGQTGEDLLARFVAEGWLHIDKGSYSYLHTEEDPHEMPPLNNIRSIESEMFTVKDMNDGETIERKRKATAYRDAHPDAIFWAKGQRYRVVDFRLDTREIYCQPESNSRVQTRGIEEREIAIIEVDADSHEPGQHQLPEGYVVRNGEIKITTNVRKYLLYQIEHVKQCKNRDCRHETPDLKKTRCPKCGTPLRIKQIEKIIDTKNIPSQVPLTRSLQTRATWIEIQKSVKNKFESDFWPRWVVQRGNDVQSEPNFTSALHSVEHALLKALPEFVNCDGDEIGGLYQEDMGNGKAAIFVYDNFPGGLGYADEFSLEFHSVLEVALSIIETCTCIDDHGCPVCLAHFSCTEFNTSLSKLSARYLLYQLLGKDTTPVVEALKDFVHVYISPSQTIQKNA